MNGTASKDADPLYKGILDYYAGISGLDITASQLATRDKYKAANGIICPDSLDTQVLAIQARFVSEDNPATKVEIVKEVISLLAV